jgi:hypothetical protein
MHMPAILCASTNAAAVRLGNTVRTVHDAFAIPIKPDRYFSPLRPTTNAYLELQAARVIICDEAFMLSSDTLQRLVMRLQETGQVGLPDAVLTERIIILLGDHQQLPPVCHCPQPPQPPDSFLPPPACRRCHIRSNPWYAHGRVHRLRISMRHASDPEFSAFLEAAADHHPTAEEVQRVLGQCLVGPEEAARLIQSGAMVLCTHREDVARANSAGLAAHWRPRQIVQVQPAFDTQGFQEWESWCTSTDFHRLVAFAVGAPVVFTRTVNKNALATNQAAGTVTDFNVSDGTVSSISVRIASSGETISVSRSDVNNQPHNGLTVWRKTFPLELGYAVTAHRIQGATLTSHTLVHPRRAFAQGQINVLLSRVTDRKFLHLTRLPHPQEFDTMQL